MDTEKPWSDILDEAVQRMLTLEVPEGHHPDHGNTDPAPAIADIHNVVISGPVSTGPEPVGGDLVRFSIREGLNKRVVGISAATRGNSGNDVIEQRGEGACSRTDLTTL